MLFAISGVIALKEAAAKLGLVVRRSLPQHKQNGFAREDAPKRDYSLLHDNEGVVARKLFTSIVGFRSTSNSWYPSHSVIP